MIYICYDISDTKTRTKFHKFLKKHGRPMQYSVFEIKNSARVLKIILLEIEKKYAKIFKYSDSIIIIPVSPADRKKIKRYGGLVQEESDFVWIQ
jgi:CRISPR-associated protein Cas2